jgi:hypothetical protein
MRLGQRLQTDQAASQSHRLYLHNTSLFCTHDTGNSRYMQGDNNLSPNFHELRI